MAVGEAGCRGTACGGYSLKLTNPFAIAMALLNVAAGVYELVKNKDGRMFTIFLCYAVASVALGIRKN